MEGQSIDDMTAYAIGKLHGGWSRGQAVASIREMLAAEQWPAQAIEATVSQVEARIREKDQPDPSATIIEMMH